MGLINISYTASDGTEFDLMAKGFRRISAGAFHDWKWAPDTTARQYGVRINKMQKKALEYEAKIMFQGTANERRKALNSFHSAIDMDCFNQNPGTLRWGNSYIRSYVTESSVEPDKERPDRTIRRFLSPRLVTTRRLIRIKPTSTLRARILVTATPTATRWSWPLLTWTLTIMPRQISGLSYTALL